MEKKFSLSDNTKSDGCSPQILTMIRIIHVNNKYYILLSNCWKMVNNRTFLSLSTGSKII